MPAPSPKLEPQILKDVVNVVTLTRRHMVYDAYCITYSIKVKKIFYFFKPFVFYDFASGGTMTIADFRRIALSFDGAEEGSHHGSPDFRVGGRIFATLAAAAKGYGNVRLLPRSTG